MGGPKPAILMSWVIISMAIRAFCWASEICSLARTALPVVVSATMPANTITDVTAVATMISTSVNPCSFCLSRDLISVRPPLSLSASHSGAIIVFNRTCLVPGTQAALPPVIVLRLDPVQVTVTLMLF